MKRSNRPRMAKNTITRPPPSTMTAAPIAIGNTVRGMETIVRKTAEGELVIGRDFAFAPIATAASITNWCLVGGAPLAPAAFVDSTLRQYLQMYNKFRFRSIIAHYITSSPTTANGDIVFYYNKNRESPFLSQTSNNFLPYVLSDPNTIMGPQWQNHSAMFTCADTWRSTDYGLDSSVSLYADGDLFLLSKTSTVDSPGYVIMDYAIEFKERSIIPRLLSLPVTKVLWNQMAMNGTAAVTVNNPIQMGNSGGLNLSGTASILPAGIVDGDIFKVIVDRTNSSLGANSNFILTSNIINAPGFVSTLTWNDGTSFYCTYSSALGGFQFYASLVSAVDGGRALLYSGTGAIAATTIQVWLSFVGAITGINNQPNF